MDVCSCVENGRSTYLPGFVTDEIPDTSAHVVKVPNIVSKTGATGAPATNPAVRIGSR